MISLFLYHLKIGVGLLGNGFVYARRFCKVVVYFNILSSIVLVHWVEAIARFRRSGIFLQHVEKRNQMQCQNLQNKQAVLIPTFNSSSFEFRRWRWSELAAAPSCLLLKSFSILPPRVNELEIERSLSLQKWLVTQLPNQPEWCVHNMSSPYLLAATKEV